MGQMIDKSGVFIPFQNQGLAVLRTDLGAVAPERNNKSEVDKGVYMKK